MTSRGVWSRLSSSRTRSPTPSMASRSMRGPNEVTTWRPITIHPGLAMVMSRSSRSSSRASWSSPVAVRDVSPPSMRQTPSSSGIRPSCSSLIR